MKQLLFSLCLLTLSPAAQADGTPEIVRLQGSLSFLRCVAQLSGTVCERAATEATLMEITLTEAEDEPGTFGEHHFRVTESGTIFDAIVTVNKTETNGLPQYVVQAFVASAPENDPTQEDFDFIGKAVVKGDISRLNELIWTGRTVGITGGSVTPFVTIGL